jgi:hypothetical protein
MARENAREIHYTSLLGINYDHDHDLKWGFLKQLLFFPLLMAKFSSLGVGVV